MPTDERRKKQMARLSRVLFPLFCRRVANRFTEKKEGPFSLDDIPVRLPHYPMEGERSNSTGGIAAGEPNIVSSKVILEKVESDPLLIFSRRSVQARKGERRLEGEVRLAVDSEGQVRPSCGNGLALCWRF